MEGKELAEYGPMSKRAAIVRILRDIQRFNEDQIRAIIAFAHKIRRSRHLLGEAAHTLEELVLSIPDRTGRAAEEPRSQPDLMASLTSSELGQRGGLKRAENAAAGENR